MEKENGLVGIINYGIRSKDSDIKNRSSSSKEIVCKSYINSDSGFQCGLEGLFFMAFSRLLLQT